MTEFITWLGWRDHFFLVPGLGVGCVRVNTFIADRRRWDHALCSAGGGIGYPPSSARVDRGEQPPRSHRLRERAARQKSSASATHNAELAQNRGIASPTNTKTSP